MSVAREQIKAWGLHGVETIDAVVSASGDLVALAQQHAGGGAIPDAVREAAGDLLDAAVALGDSLPSGDADFDLHFATAAEEWCLVAACWREVEAPDARGALLVRYATMHQDLANAALDAVIARMREVGLSLPISAT